MRHDLVSLRLFVLACSQGSITKAASSLHLAVSAASRRITLLEHDAKSTLLVRRPQGIQLTAAGATMLRYAEDVLRLHDDLSSKLEENRSGVRGFVRVSASSSVLIQRLGADLGGFMADHPGIKLDLVERPSAATLEALVQKQVDLGVVVRGIEPPGLSAFEYGGDTLCIAVSGRHPLASRKALKFENLLEHDLISLEPTSETYRLLQEKARLSGRFMKIRVHARSFEVMCTMISQGLGIGILPDKATQSLAVSLDLRLVRLDEAWARRRFLVCLREFTEPGSPAMRLATFLAKPNP